MVFRYFKFSSYGHTAHISTTTSPPSPHRQSVTFEGTLIYINQDPLGVFRRARSVVRVRVRVRCSYGVRTVFARCSPVVRTVFARCPGLFVRCSYGVRPLFGPVRTVLVRCSYGARSLFLRLPVKYSEFGRIAVHTCYHKLITNTTLGQSQFMGHGSYRGCSAAH